MTSALRPKQVSEDDIAELSAAETVLIVGDLSVLTAAQRVEYYAKVCESLGLNPLTSPFAYLNLNGKLTLYARKDATDQLRSLRGISVYKLERDQTAESYDVTAYGRDRSGREDASLGSVSISNLRGENLANAKMRAETKAKRRLTLSLAGLGWLDEVEVDSIASAQAVTVTETGEILPPEPPKTLQAVVASQLATEPREDPAPAQAATDSTPAPSGSPAAAPEPPVKSGAIDEAAAAVFGDLVVETPPQVGISAAELKAMAKNHGVMGQALVMAAERLFPGVDPKNLTGDQRYELWLDVKAQSDAAKAEMTTAKAI